MLVFFYRVGYEIIVNLNDSFLYYYDWSLEMWWERVGSKFLEIIDILFFVYSFIMSKIKCVGGIYKSGSKVGK